MISAGYVENKEKQKTTSQFQKKAPAKIRIAGVPGKILQNPFVNDRVGIKNLADAFQFRSVGVVDAGDHERHLFLIVFAHFLGTPFSVFVVILIVCTLFITTLR